MSHQEKLSDQLVNMVVHLHGYPCPLHKHLPLSTNNPLQSHDQVDLVLSSRQTSRIMVWKIMGTEKPTGGECSSNYRKRPCDTYFVRPISVLPTLDLLDLNDPVLSRGGSTQPQTQKKLLPSSRTTRDRWSVYACSNTITINEQTRLYLDPYQ